MTAADAGPAAGAPDVPAERGHDAPRRVGRESGSSARPRAPRWVQITLIWAASRAATTALMLFFAAREGRTGWAPAHPGYLRFAQFWDSGWFHTIAVSGYPIPLPLDAAGHVHANAWAFLPAYPAVVSLVMGATGLSWDVASVAVAAACSLGAALVLDRLLTTVLHRPATFTVALFCFGPLSAVLQVAYAESMGVLLLAAALLLIVQGRYLMLIPVVLLADLTRPVGPPLAAAVAAVVGLRLLPHAVGRLRGARLVAALGAVAAAGVGAVLWPVVAGLATGKASAYVASEVAWRRGRDGDGFVPFAAWIRAAQTLSPFGLLGLGLGVAAFAAVLVALPAVRRLGPEIRIWAAVYALYLLAVFDPQSSTFRLLLPLFPLAGAFAGVRSVTGRVGLLALGVAGQFAWIAATWARWHVSGWAPP